ncbi:MAG: glycosyltransferase [Actinomycetia bacterium]|nr:glycosyltransferase [Actinomycetes bacterium]
MRIAFVTDTYSPEVNGAVTSIVTHTRLLAERGHEILIMAPTYGEYTDEAHPGITVHRYPSVSFVTNKATRVAAPSIIDMVARLRAFEPEIVHIHTPLTIGIAGLLAAKTLHLPAVQTYHTYIPDFMQYVEPARLLRLDTLQERIMNSIVFERVMESGVWQTLERSRALVEERADEFVDAVTGISADVAERRPEFTTRLAWRYTRLIYNRSDLVLTPSIALKRALLSHGITAPVEYVSNGIDVDLIARKESYEPSGRIVHAGRLGFEKNVDVVIEAFARVAEKHPGLVLDIRGDGPARGSLERLAATLGLESHVRFTGFVDRAVLAREYRDYDCFVTASTMETQGIVLLEAMAAGLPVVGVRALAVPEIVRSARDGIVVPPGDVQSFAHAIERLVSDDQLRERLGRQSAVDVQRHAIKSVVSELERLYRQTAASYAKA